MLWPRASAPPVWGAVVASPVIGLVVGLAFRWIHRLRGARRAVVSLHSLYAAAALFGVVVGFTDLARLLALDANVIPSAVVLQAIPAVLWGLTFTGYFLVLWPLVHLNHQLLGRVLSPPGRSGEARACAS